MKTHLVALIAVAAIFSDNQSSHAANLEGDWQMNIVGVDEFPATIQQFGPLILIEASPESGDVQGAGITFSEGVVWVGTNGTVFIGFANNRGRAKEMGGVVLGLDGGILWLAEREGDDEEE